MMERLICFENEGCRLYGILGSPDSAQPRAGVVVVHGWSGCRMGPHQILVKLCRQLNEEGYSTLRFDLRGRGESEGDTASANLDGMISDTATAVNYMRSEAGAQTVGVVGICSGGNVVIGAGTLLKEPLPLVAWSTLPFQTHKNIASDVRKTGSFAAEYVKKAFRPSTWKKLFAGRINFGLVKRVLFGHYTAPEDAEGRNPKDSDRDIMGELENYEGPVQFIYGGSDPEAQPAHDLYAEFCAAHDIDAEFHFIEGANHSFYSVEWEKQVIGESAQWLREKLPAEE